MLTDVWDALITETEDFERARRLFREMLRQDEALLDEFREWCEMAGCSERDGFSVYYRACSERIDAIWDSLYPNREEYDGYEFSRA